MKNIVITIILTVVAFSFTNAQETGIKEKKKWKFGLHFDNLSPDQKAFNAETTGVIINEVSKDHPGEMAGIMIGDILTHIDEISIKDQDHCVQVMKDFDTSKGTATLKIIRNGVKMDKKVVFK